MNWTDKKIWRKSFVSTFLCLIGCSIGTMGVIHYFPENKLWITLLASFIIGLISCFIFISCWKMIFLNESLLQSLRDSLKMSLVSMFIMMIIENLIMFQFNNQQNFGAHHGSPDKSLIMLVAMLLGFFCAIPYNYYQLQKSGKICH